MIICTDFDKTLAFAPYPHVGNPNTALINHLIECRKHGDKIILWTMREGAVLDLAVDFCKSFGLEFDAVNANLPELVEQWGGDSRKVFADVYIDDKAYNVRDYMKRYCEKRRGTVRGIKVRG